VKLVEVQALDETLKMAEFSGG